MFRGIQHVRARHDPLDQKRPEQDRCGDAARNAKGNRGYQIPASGRVIGSSGAKHSFHSTLAETLLVRRALHRVGVCHPLRRAASHSWKYADIRAESAALENQPPVAEGIFHPLHDTTQLSNLLTGDARPFNSQVDNLGDGKESYSHGNQVDTVPQEN